ENVGAEVSWALRYATCHSRKETISTGHPLERARTAHAASSRHGTLLRCALHRLDDLRIGGAATEIAGEIVLDLVVVRIGMAVEQLLGHQDEAGRAEAALERTLLDEGLLHRIEVAA